MYGLKNLQTVYIACVLAKKRVLIKTQCKIFLSMKQPLRGVLVNSCFKNLLHDEIFLFDNKIQEKKITAQLQFNEIL